MSRCVGQAYTNKIIREYNLKFVEEFKDLLGGGKDCVGVLARVQERKRAVEKSQLFHQQPVQVVMACAI